MSTAASDLRLSYTSRDFDSILAELTAIVAQTRPGLQSDFFESSLGTMLIQLNAYLGDLISHGQDAIASDVFLATMRRYASALRYARSVGYTPRSAVAAEVTVTAVALPDQVTTLGATVPAGATVQSSSGLKYELLEDAVIPIGSTISKLNLFQGESFEEAFEPTTQPRQEISVENGVVADGSQRVFVGDTGNPANEWTLVSNVALEESPTETYEISYDGNGRLKVRFGDGTAGKIPDDTVTVFYRTTDGLDGNVPIYAVRGSVQAVLGGGPGTISITYENSEGAATGGSDRESIDELRANIPAYIRSIDKVLTLLDYNTNVPRVSGVALAFTDVLTSSYAGNAVKVNVWDQETVDFTSESPSDLTRSTVDYTRYSQLSEDRANEIQAFLRSRTLETVHNIIGRPDIAWVDVYLGRVTYDSTFDLAAIHANITQAVVAAFQASSGFAIRVSEVYNAIRDVRGVLYFNIDRIIFEHLAGTKATGSVTFDGGAQPLNGETVTISDGANIKIFEFDDDASVGAGNIPVTIGANAPETLRNLKNGIHNNLGLLADEDDTAIDPKLDIEQLQAGAAYNIPITTTGVNITVVGMSGGDDTLTTQIEDHRRVQEPVPDPYPVGAYAPGEPFVPAGPAWQDGGQLPYVEIKDIVIQSATTLRNFYDESFLYNNEIFYNSGVGAAVGVQAINLRRLVFDLSPA